MTDIDITNTEVAASLRRMRELPVGTSLHPDLDEPDTDMLDASAVEETLIDEIMRLRTALTSSLAREAAAFELAAKLCEDNEVGTSPRLGYVVAPFYRDENSGKHPGMAYGPPIRDLTPADAQAALQSMIDAAVKEALIDAARLVDEKYAAGEMGNPGHHIRAKIGGSL